MNSQCGKWIPSGRGQFGALGLGLALIVGLGVGCAHSDGGYKSTVALQPPKLPAFFSSPMAIFLTNAPDFSARLMLETFVFSNRTEVVTGTLLGRGGKFLFVAETSTTGKKTRRGNDNFIWDAIQNSGYVLNDALQGYALVTNSLRFTNLVTKPGSTRAGVELIAGHRCEVGDVTVNSTDGSVANFRVWRAADLKGFPLRVQSLANYNTTLLNLAELRLQPLPDGLFLPPDGFTKYASVDAMFHELLERRASFTRRTPVLPEEPDRGYSRPNYPGLGYR